MLDFIYSPPLQKSLGNVTLEDRAVMAARRKSMDPGVPHGPDSEGGFVCVFDGGQLCGKDGVI